MSEGQDVTVTAFTGARGEDELTLIVGGREIGGWEEIDVTLTAEAFPNSFTVQASAQIEVERLVTPGAEVVVRIGYDTVVSGFVDRVRHTGTPGSHTIAVTGRGRTQDLVDCSAEWPSGQLIDGNALTIAETLCAPYGLVIELGEGAEAGEQVPAWLLNFGETGAAIVQRLARNAGLLAYEDAHGVLKLAKLGTTAAAGGLRYGVNVEQWTVERSMDARFSDYVCAMMSSDQLLDVAGDAGSIFYHKEVDPNVTRHRQMDLALEVVATDPVEFTKKRAQWEAARRAGRGNIVQATTDSWRDAAGTLWTPNTLVPVDLPGNGAGSPLVLAEVSFRRSNESGTTAELVLMDKQAFAIEPITLNPVNLADVLGPDQPAAGQGAGQ